MEAVIDQSELRANHFDERHIITNRRSSLQHLEGESWYFTRLTQLATESGSQAQTLNEYPTMIYKYNFGDYWYDDGL